ncbi:MAG: indoleamine 2,3-dioxygenase [Ponticaulis sp.]|nr:indoleamine 2,3-dioxygenase [Ponticaulis sp.]|tara:strand:- start:28692 stop:29882 length:1191 start_codon:yes stop_codon:yes gene_type:complete
MSVLPLSSYDMSETGGFLCIHDPAKTTLKGKLAEIAEIAMSLPDLLPSGQVRHHLTRQLPDIMPAEINELGDAEARKAMVHYSFMVQAYVWGDAEAPASLPACLAIPMVALAEKIGQQPLLPYSGYVLDNWSRLDADSPIALDNIYMIQNFLSGMDEAWFVLIHVAIEAAAGQVLASMAPVIEASARGDVGTTRTLLEAMAERWALINSIFDRMPERCDPYIYFERVRPYIHGWKDNPALPNGLIYEGVEKFGGKGQAFRGQTGSQSSIVPSMDALLGVGHAADPLRAYLDELHIYRPPAHRRFINDVRSTSQLRSFVSKVQNPGLADAYNANIQAVADFRSRHLEYAASYINRQSGRGTGNDTDVGTGGTPFMRYLKKHRDETRDNLIRVYSPAG